ncbi:hypothetical protein JYP52_11250 [Nitratireductor aquibiodomus]|uniref:hypothetical protein n=1 Tax=Nitratireductor aquibiodomus TaxID=204799 RepID=UPI0019D3C821|nr:hypothetical protein [Nitratireductor aquibiodomus]MBN7761717.1 hypothetical protein [Nitratireductor aquibiodomus]
MNELQSNQSGNGAIKKGFEKYCNLANNYNVFIFTDLDSAKCAPSLRRSWIDSSKVEEPLPDGMHFNIAVKEVEAWLLADHENLKAYLGVRGNKIPRDTQMDNPKEFLLQYVRRFGNRKAKEELLPKGAAPIGLGYNRYLGQFVEEHWDFESAAERNESLQRALTRIKAVRMKAP